MQSAEWLVCSKWLAWQLQSSHLAGMATAKLLVPAQFSSLELTVSSVSLMLYACNMQKVLCISVAKQSWQIIVSHTCNRLNILTPLRDNFFGAIEQFWHSKLPDLTNESHRFQWEVIAAHVT